MIREVERADKYRVRVSDTSDWHPEKDDTHAQWEESIAGPVLRASEALGVSCNL